MAQCRGEPVKVTIRLGNGNHQEISRTMIQLEVSSNQTVRDVLALLQAQFHDLNIGELDLDRRAFLVLIDGVEISACANLETEITQPCEIVIIPVIHGG